jgi:hypothetical protein
MVLCIVAVIFYHTKLFAWIMSVSKNIRSHPILHLDMLHEENESVLEKVTYQLSSLYCEM